MFIRLRGCSRSKCTWHRKHRPSSSTVELSWWQTSQIIFFLSEYQFFSGDAERRKKSTCGSSSYLLSCSWSVFQAFPFEPRKSEYDTYVIKNDHKCKLTPKCGFHTFCEPILSEWLAFHLKNSQLQELTHEQHVKKTNERRMKNVQPHVQNMHTETLVQWHQAHTKAQWSSFWHRHICLYQFDISIGGPINFGYMYQK